MPKSVVEEPARSGAVARNAPETLHIQEDQRVKNKLGFFMIQNIETKNNEIL